MQNSVWYIYSLSCSGRESWFSVQSELSPYNSHCRDSLCWLLLKQTAGEMGFGFGKDEVGVFGTWHISAACAQTTGQGFPIEVHPLMFTEYIDKKKITKAKFLKRTLIFFSCYFFFFFCTDFTWHKKICIPSLFFISSFQASFQAPFLRKLHSLWILDYFSQMLQ